MDRQTPNTPPTANDDFYTAIVDTALDVLSPGVLGNDSDIDGNSLTAILDSSSIYGSLLLNSDGSFQYTPNQGYLGPDSFSYFANDGEDDSNIATVSITVNDEPVIQQAFFDDFASSFVQWTESNEFDWNVELPDEKQVPNHPSSNNVAHADNCDKFCVLTVTNPVDLSSYNDATLSFWRYVDASLDSNEYLKVQISSDGGNNWDEIASWGFNNGSDDDTWNLETFDLTGYLTNNFKMQFVTKESKSNEVVEIDDVLIDGTT